LDGQYHQPFLNELIMEKPATIFKYEAFSVQSLQNLKTQSIWFGSPFEFNDPYDCAIFPSIVEPTAAESELIREYHLSTSSSSLSPSADDYRDWYRGLNESELRTKHTKNAQTSIRDNVKEWRNIIAVTCFTKCNDDLLMWAHYGGKYKGICLEFATDYKPFFNLEQVKYVENIPIFKYADMLLKDDIDQLAKLLVTKSKKWEYESEWRIFEKKHENEKGRLIAYETSALKSIYFGPEIEDSSIGIIRDILAVQNPNVKFFRGERSQEEFKVLFVEIK
jgi:Protein of unknown function (DUF2971)